MIFIKAFLVGGLICVVGQLLLDLTKLTPAKILVGFVVAGVILGGIGVYTIIKRKIPKIVTGKTIGIFVILIGVLTLLHMSYVDKESMDPNKFNILKITKLLY